MKAKHHPMRCFRGAMARWKFHCRCLEHTLAIPLQLCPPLVCSPLAYWSSSDFRWWMKSLKSANAGYQANLAGSKSWNFIPKHLLESEHSRQNTSISTHLQRMQRVCCKICETSAIHRIRKYEQENLQHEINHGVSQDYLQNFASSGATNILVIEIQMGYRLFYRKTEHGRLKHKNGYPAHPLISTADLIGYCLADTVPKCPEILRWTQRRTHYEPRSWVRGNYIPTASQTAANLRACTVPGLLWTEIETRTRAVTLEDMYSASKLYNNDFFLPYMAWIRTIRRAWRMNMSIAPEE